MFLPVASGDLGDKDIRMYKHVTKLNIEEENGWINWKLTSGMNAT